MEFVVITQEQFETLDRKLEFILSKVSTKHEPDKPWLSCKEAQKMLNIGQTTLWNYRNQGIIKAKKSIRSSTLKELICSNSFLLNRPKILVRLCWRAT